MEGRNVSPHGYVNLGIFSELGPNLKCDLISTGVLTFALSIVLGITSLPSVTSSMTWKEFAFVQSKLGWIALLLACAHDMFYGWPYMDAPSCYIPSSFQVRILYKNQGILTFSIFTAFLNRKDIFHNALR